LILVNWLPHSVDQAMPTLLLIWSSYPMEPNLHPSRFLPKSAMDTITIADRAQLTSDTWKDFLQRDGSSNPPQKRRS